MKLVFRITLVSLIVSCLALVALPRTAAAHPLGNFTVNQYSALTVGEGRVDVLYVVDMAEIPAFQELGTIRADHSSDLTPAERDGYASRKSAELARGLSLSVDGRPARLSVSKTALSFPPGAGGLPTLRFEMYLTAPLDTAQKGSLEYKVGNFNERIGWREIIAAPAGGTSFESASVPATDRSNALRTYSSDLMSSPPAVTSASLVFVPGAAGAGPRQAGARQAAPLRQPGSVGAVREPPLPGWAQGRADVLTDLIARKHLPLGAFLVALVIAFGFGAGHALSPGHGKTVVAAYLVGSRGTPAHAALLGVTVTVSHTIGVFLLGLVVLFASDYILPEKLYPWLGFSSGFLIAILGLALFAQRLRAWRRAAHAATHTHPHDGHTHTHDGYTHTHDHDHDHQHTHHLEHSHDGDEHHHTHEDEHHHHNHSGSQSETQNSKLKTQNSHRHGLFSRPHTHVPVDGQKVTLWGLLALGITGGIIPCPSALVVLLVAVYFGKVALGLSLILAFSLGLASVLTGIGLLMVYGRGLLARVRFNSGLLGRLPMASALAVVCLGVVLAFGSLSQGGVLR